MAVWTKLYDENGVLNYEGMAEGNRPCGVGTVYFPNGNVFQEGVFGNKGLLCGTEYYPNGNRRFSGLYKYNTGFGPNYPVCGKCYFRTGKLYYSGELRVKEHSVGWPRVIIPKRFGYLVQKEKPSMEFFEHTIEIIKASDL